MNAEQLQNAWQQVYDLVLSYDDIERTQASAFLSQLQPQAMSDGFLMLTAETEFTRDWIERHYSSAIKQALTDIYSIPYTVAFEVNPGQQSRPVISQAPEPQPQQQAQAQPQVQPQIQPQFQQQPQPQQEISVQQETFTAVPTTSVASPVVEETVITAEPLVESNTPCAAEKSCAQAHETYAMPTSSLTFENFVIGSSNQMAYSMAHAVAEDPGRSMLNPLFIYGRSGLGKTHLLRAIQNHVNKEHPELTAIYVDSADLVNQYVEASVTHDKEKASFKNFKNNYQEADILLIDDVQYLQGKTQTLDIIFQIFNYMVDQGKQVVLSADRAPKNIDMDERYQSRFNSGGTFDIQPPEIETKLAIIKSLVDEYRMISDTDSFSLPEEIMLYIAEISGPNIRELKSAVTKVIYAKNTLTPIDAETDITKEQVSELLQNHFTGGATKKLSIVDIQKAVEQYYDVSHSDLIGQKRVRKIAYARQIAIYLTREMLGLPYDYIAKSFGGRDHSTIMYSVQSVEEKKKNNRDVAEEIENIIRRIRES